VDTASIKIGWSVDGRYLAAANLDHTISIWDLDRPEDPWILQGCSGKIRRLVWSKQVRQPILAVATGTDVAIWQWADIDLGWTGTLLGGHEDIVTAIAIHPDDTTIASAAVDGYVCWWTTTGAVIQILEDTSTLSRFTHLVWNREGSQLLTGDENGHLAVWLVAK
jgi:WD40 repeat protein